MNDSINKNINNTIVMIELILCVAIDGKIHLMVTNIYEVDEAIRCFKFQVNTLIWVLCPFD